MEEHESTSDFKSALARATEKYSEATKLRALVQVIPYIGGSLDTLFGGKGAEIQRKRIENFLRSLDRRLKGIEKASPVAAEEGFFDFIHVVLEGVIRSRTREKITRFSSLVANQVIERRQWDEADAAARLLGDLSEIHIKVLLAVMNAPPLGEPFDKLRIATLFTKPPEGGAKAKAKALTAQFPDYNAATLRMACADLVSKGLLHDEGVGRFDTKAMEMFVSTDLAKWLITWIHERNQKMST